MTDRLTSPSPANNGDLDGPVVETESHHRGNRALRKVDVLDRLVGVDQDLALRQCNLLQSGPNSAKSSGEEIQSRRLRKEDCLG
jgi:hypothetical protein